MAYVEIHNPSSIPLETSINMGKYWKIYDFKNDDNTKCFIIYNDGNRGDLTIPNATNFIKHLKVEGRAINPTTISSSTFRNTHTLCTTGLTLSAMTITLAGLLFLGKD